MKILLALAAVAAFATAPALAQNAGGHDHNGKDGGAAHEHHAHGGAAGDHHYVKPADELDAHCRAMMGKKADTHDHGHHKAMTTADIKKMHARCAAEMKAG